MKLALKEAETQVCLFSDYRKVSRPIHLLQKVRTPAGVEEQLRLRCIHCGVVVAYRDASVPYAEGSVRTVYIREGAVSTQAEALLRRPHDELPDAVHEKEDAVVIKLRVISSLSTARPSLKDLDSGYAAISIPKDREHSDVETARGFLSAVFDIPEHELSLDEGLALCRLPRAYGARRAYMRLLAAVA